MIRVNKMKSYERPSPQIRISSTVGAAGLALAAAALLTLAATPAAVATAAATDDYAHTASLTAFGLGARALGMGGAFVAVADAANALYYNPAGLAGLEGSEVISQYESRFGLLNTLAVGYAHDGWGAGYIGYELGDIERRDEFANAVGDNFAVGETMLIGAYSHRLAPVDLGASLKHYSQTLDKESGSGITADLGALWQPEAALYRVGLAVRNVLGSVDYSNDTSDPFDRTIVLGAAYDGGNWLAAVDKELPGFLRVGAEYEGSDIVTLRAGAYGDEQWTITAGLGVAIDQYNVQYAYEQPSVLDGTHRLSFGVQF